METISTPSLVLSPNQPGTEVPSRSSETTFVHQRLDLSKKEIRLFKIDPSSNAKAIYLKIQHFNLEKCPDYQALSYTWGDPTITKDIYIDDGRRFEVRHNLWSFLNTQCTGIDHIQRDIWYWVDALCINQTDTLERSHQVQRMALIYSRAWQVVLWLGLSANDSDFAFSLLATHHRLRKSKDAYHYCTETDDCVYGPRFKTAFEALLSRIYWRRMWVIQEIVLAASPILQCGHSTVEWDIFEPQVGKPGGGYLYASYIVSMRSRWKINSIFEPEDSGEYSGLIHFVLRCIRFECADVRDKIYGLQGMVRPDERIVVDYSKSIYEIFEDVFQVISSIVRDVDQRCFYFDILIRELKIMECSGDRPKAVEDLYRNWDPRWANHPFTYWLKKKSYRIRQGSYP